LKKLLVVIITITSLLLLVSVISSEKMAEISYQVLAPERFQEAADFILTNFLPDEPTSKCLNLAIHVSTVQGMSHHMLDDFKLDDFKTGLSWCAIDKTTGKMVGLSANRNLSFAELSDDPTTFEELMEIGYPRELALGAIAEYSTLNFKQLMSAYQETKMVEIRMLSCNSSYRGMGISSKLVEQSLAHAVSLGYSLSCIVASSLFSQKIAEKFGFEKVKELEYASYVDPVTNTYLLKNVEEPHKSIISYVKKL
jgi:ribosomal protein S18 acetylase RimI-like enzyme